MAQQTALSVIGIPGPVHSFTAKGDAATGVFSEKAIHASLMDWIATNYTTADEVLDEEPFDWDAASELVAFDVSVFNSMTRRKHSTELESQSIIVTAHCYSESTTNLYRARELADAVSALFDQAEILIEDHDVTGSPDVGYARMREATIQDLTREMNAQLRTDGQHIIVTIPGVAQES